MIFGQTAHTRIYGVSAQTICALIAFFDAAPMLNIENSNRFEVCCLSFQPSQSNICLLKSTFPA